MIMTSLLVASLSTIAPNVFAEDCDQGQQLYLKGLTKGKFQKWTAAKELLSKSVSMCNRFNNWYLLGQTNMELERLDDAASAFEDARRYATDVNERAISIARYAEVQAKLGKVNQSLSLLREAKEMHANAPAWMLTLLRELDDKRVSQPLTVAMVTGALTNKSIKLLNMKSKPSINVSINFEFDSTKVVSKSKSSIAILAQALMDESLKGKTVTIIGHTDKRGSDQYNDQLSQRRAKSIASMLFKRYPSLKHRITIEGKGESLPLYTGNSSWEYQMNRRIEIAVLD